MKRKIQKIVTLLALTAIFGLLMTACTTGGADTDGGNGASASGAYVFTRGSQLDLVISMDESSSAAYSELISRIDSALFSSEAGLSVSRIPDTDPKGKHEIMLGECDRELSRQAYRELDKVQSEEGEGKFVIYSNGNSVAIAYDRGDYDVAKMAVEHFIEKYVEGKDSLVLKVGYKSAKTVELQAYYEELAAAKLEAQWAKLEGELRASYASYYKDDPQKAVTLVDETMAALRIFYDAYDKDALVKWFANLYEPDICICKAVHGLEECQGTPYCGGAGFYFSNGGRDTLGFAPDLESTAQTFGFLKNSGMLDDVGKDVAAAFPDGEAEKMIKWVKAMQDSEDGYFYHPQWSRQESKSNVARIGRDLGHAVGILSAFGDVPDYKTPSGVGGDGDSTLPTSSVRLTPKLATDRAAAVSRVIAVASSNVPSHMASREAFEKYLNGLNIRTDSYYIANEISSQSSQIKARDQELAQMGADYRLTDILARWFAENQNPEDGTWHWSYTEDPYYANNGVLKIITTYEALGIEFPNPIPAINNAIDALLSEKPINHVCDLYNTWFSIYFICNNIKKHGNSAEAAEVVWALRERAPEAIKASAIKMAPCRCEDGSFSYVPGVTSTAAQGLPVSAPTPDGEPAKGDVNATVICTYGNIDYMFGALGFATVPRLCTDADRRSFKNMIGGLDQVIKNAAIDPYDPDTFDSDLVDSPAEYEFLMTDPSKGSSLLVVKDKRPQNDGNVLRLHSGAGSWDRYIVGTKKGVGGDAFVYEASICFDSATKTNGDVVTDSTLMQLQLGSGSNATSGFYSLGARVNNSIISLYDLSSSKDGSPSSQYTELYSGISYGEWFHIKLEYFMIDEHNARIRVYIGSTREDLVLVAVSDNYFDYYANKIDNPNAIAPTVGVYATSMLSVTTNINQDILFDDICIYKSRVNYERDELPLDKNVDGPDQDEVKFGFEEITELPEGIIQHSGDSTVDINGGYLNLSSGAKLDIPANYRTSGANVASFSADVLWSGASVGKNLLSLRFTDGEINRYNVVGYDFKVKSIGGQSYLVLYERMPDGRIGTAVDLVKIAANTVTNIRIDFYHTENVALIYVDGQFLVASDATYANIRPRLIDKLEITVPDQKISLNNIVFERRKFDFVQAVEPDTPSDVQTFDSIESAEQSGVIHGNVTINGTLGMANKLSYARLPISKRSPVVSAYLTRVTVIPGESTDGDTVRLAITDASGNIIVAVDASVKLTTDGALVQIYEAGIGGKYELVIGRKTVSKDVPVDVTLIWHADEKIANVEICGVAVASTSVCYDVDSGSLTPEYGAVYSLTDKAFEIDDMVAEALYKYRTPVTLDSANPEDGKTLITYDHSTFSNIPSALTATLNAGGSNVRIAQALKKIGDAKAIYSKALVLDSRSGGNDEFSFKPSSTTVGADRVVFETEMMIPDKGCSQSGTFFQIMMTTTSGATGNKLVDGSYMFNIGVVNGMVVYSDASSTGKDPSTGDYRYEGGYIKLANVGEWFKLRVEYYQGDKDTVRTVLTVNDGEKIDILKRAYDANGNALYVDASGNITTASSSGGVNNSAHYVTDKSVDKVIGNNYFGYRAVKYPDAVPQNNIAQVLFYGQSGPHAIVYLDNTSFWGDGARFNGGEINYIKELK